MKKKLIYIFAVLALVGSCYFGWQKYEGFKKDKLRETQPYISMTQKDKARVIEIAKGVGDNTIPVTDNLKQELKTFFVKYHLSKEDIEMSRLAGFGFREPLYDTFFFEDALESLRTGTPTKSEYRAYLENLALNLGTMTPVMVEMNDGEIEKIAKKEPALNPPQILTEKDLVELLNYSRENLVKMDSLFKFSF